MLLVMVRGIVWGLNRPVNACTSCFSGYNIEWVGLKSITRIGTGLLPSMHMNEMQFAFV